MNSSQTLGVTSVVPLIEKLIIYHQDLTSNHLDESASLEELTEKILYFYEHTLHRRTFEAGEPSLVSPAVPRDRHITEKAFKYCGICEVLRSLPHKFSEIGTTERSDGEEKLDSATEVHFSNSTLVYVQLEDENHEIVAVAQVPLNTKKQLGPETLHSEGKGSDPLAICHCIQECHNLFRLLRGGGIHTRLLSTRLPEPSRSLPSQTPPSESSTSVYPGMGELMTIRKKLRKLVEESTKMELHGQQGDIPIMSKIEETAGQLMVMVNELPISSLRRDLINHYDEFISRLSADDKESTGTGSCIVDMVPRPSGSSPTQAPSVSPGAFPTLVIGQALRSLFSKHPEESPELVAASSFYKRRNLYTHNRARRLSHWKSMHITSDISSLLIEYFQSFHRRQISSGAPTTVDCSARVTPTASPTDPGHENLKQKMSMGDTSIRPSVDEDRGISIDKHVVGAFLQPPLLSMMHMSDTIYSVEVPQLGMAWTPQVFIKNSEPDHDNAVQLNVALLEWNEYSTLFYFAPLSSESNIDEAATGRFLQSLQIKMSSAFIRIRDRGLMSPEKEKDELVSDFERLDEQPHVTSEEGVDLIFVDRSSGTLVLETRQHRIPCEVPKKGKLRIKALSSRKVGGAELSSSRSILGKDRSFSTLPATGLDSSALHDCRRCLASWLSDEVVAAFDDMFNEIYYHQRMSEQDRYQLNKSKNNMVSWHAHGDGRAIEMCTTIAQGWVYGNCEGDKELYILFDHSKYVTIADVLHSAARIKQEVCSNSSC